MTNLKCSVRGCIYNDSNMCSRTEINVGNKKAENVKETLCESFSNDEAVRNACICKEPEGRLTIKCDAIKCIYNDNNYCSADSVDIGDSSADTSRETKCETFKLSM